ncbi:LysR family transcriptional regulator [Brucella pseudogrignonensis]|uniref:LysR family transcriptional regulator n=1 Tax=Brucella pseudogrignonensis TaxID=419475 RepID=UPI0007DA798D|nr:LysR family transcriptional regulator [Brucella pseudogrignonensis]ANG98747.1 LysR family transcriptional regulator [Brucella pseudogrignonensis]
MGFDSRLLSGIGVLSAVVEAGSFMRAGEAIGLTQSAVSRSVARLEERVGLRIFHRNARSITLTDEGRRFYEQVAPLLSGIEEAATRAAGSGAEVRGRLRINVDGCFGHYVLGPRVKDLLVRHPQLSLEMHVRDRMGDLVADGFDVGIHFGTPEPSSLSCRLLMETRILTCASPDYVARHGLPVHPRDIEGQECILMRSPATGKAYGWDFIKGNEAFEIMPKGQMTVTDTGGLLAACLSGQGIAQPLEVYTRPLLDERRLVQLLPDWAEETFPLYVYHHGPRQISAKVKAFLEFLDEVLDQSVKSQSQNAPASCRG